MATADTRSVDEIVEEMTRRVVARFDPLQVILFGSRARGDADEDSDVDLLVVFPHVENSRTMAVAILDELSGMGIAKGPSKNKLPIRAIEVRVGDSG
jgi:predicted nucleotidyltransferase